MKAILSAIRFKLRKARQRACVCKNVAPTDPIRTYLVHPLPLDEIGPSLFSLFLHPIHPSIYLSIYLPIYLFSSILCIHGSNMMSQTFLWSGNCSFERIACICSLFHVRNIHTLRSLYRLPLFFICCYLSRITSFPFFVVLGHPIWRIIPMDGSAGHSSFIEIKTTQCFASIIFTFSEIHSRIIQIYGLLVNVL